MTVFTAPEPIAEVQRVVQGARRAETPCGDGVIVWHIWGEATADSSSRPLVLFHGGSGSWTHWLRNIQTLADSGRAVYVPDLPGFGDSAVPPGGGDADALPEPLSRGLDLLLQGAACDLVGFSFGGLTAAFLTSRFPEQVARLILVGVPALGISVPVQLHSWRHLPESQQRDAVHRNNLAALMFHSRDQITETALRLHVANVLRDRMKLRSLARTDVLARMLPTFHCRVDAIFGQDDALYRGKAVALEAAMRKAPYFGSFTFIESAGHWVQFERAAAFNQTLLALLDEC